MVCLKRCFSYTNYIKTLSTKKSKTHLLSWEGI